MDNRADAIDELAFLVRSEARVRILAALLESGPATQRELRDELEASRSTIARALGSLEERNWIEREPGSYRLTPVGELVVEEVLGVLETIRTADELSAFFAWFPHAEFDLDPLELRNARVITAAPGDPYRPGRAQTEFLRATRRFRGFLPSIDLEGTRFVHERIVDGQLEAEIVVSPDVERTIGSGEFASLFREQLRTGRLTVLVAEDGLPFYLGLADDGTVQIGVEDDDGFPRALLEASDGSIADWAEEVYRDSRERARVKSLEEF